VNYEALNGWVLAAIACFAFALYVAVLWVGWANIQAYMRKRGEIGKRERSGRHARRYQKTKRAG
jgi:hypothetical protein